MPVCKAPGCENRYTPTRNWQKYCSDKCRNSRHTKKLAAGSTGVRVLDAAMAWHLAKGQFSYHERLREACAAHAVEVEEGKNER